MCEGFLCIRLVESGYGVGPTRRILPEPCYEDVNCEICELMYDCRYCASRQKCKQASEKVVSAGKALKNTSRKDH